MPVDALRAAATKLGITDVDEHAVRIRRSLHDDPGQEIGSAKELLETVLKSILGRHGTGEDAKIDMRLHVQLWPSAYAVTGTEAGVMQLSGPITS